MKATLTLFIVILLAACSSKLYIPSEANVNKREPATLAELGQGHDIYKKSCGGCHRLYKPDSRIREQWTKVLKVMGPKAKLSDDKVALVYKYLVNH